MLIALAEFFCSDEAGIEWGYLEPALYHKGKCSIISIGSLKEYVDKIATYQEERREGAFIISGLALDAGKENSLRNLRLKDEVGKIVVCMIEKKSSILAQLDQFELNQATLFLEMDLVTGCIK